MHGAHNTCWNAHHTLRKNAYALVHAHICNGVEASLPWKLLQTYLESCASIVHAVVCLPLLLPRTVSTIPVARRCSLKKSVQIHASSWRGRRCGIAPASFDHPRWCRPHPVCLSAALVLGHGAYPSQKSVSPFFAWVFNISFSTVSSSSSSLADDLTFLQSVFSRNARKAVLRVKGSIVARFPTAWQCLGLNCRG